MSHEIAKTPVDPTQFPEAAHKFAQQALLEHQRAEKDVMKAVEHVVKSGQALLKAYDLCEYGQWEGFFEMHFKDKTNPDDRIRPLSLRTGYKSCSLPVSGGRSSLSIPLGSRRKGKPSKHLRRSPAPRKIGSPKRSAEVAPRAAQVATKLATKATEVAPRAAQVTPSVSAPVPCGECLARSSTRRYVWSAQSTRS